jgi:hypothetical protein
MKHLSRIAVLTLLVFLFVTSCSKSNSSTAKTKTELLTQSSWKFSNAKVSGADVSAFLQACQKDNILVFATAGTGTLDEGATKCNSSDPQSNPFTWNFASNETVLHVSTVLFTGGSSDFDIVSLTDAQLVLSQNITVQGSTQNAVVTFIH